MVGGVVLPGNDGVGVQYSFFNVDQVYDFLVSIGMKPYVELRCVTPGECAP